MKSCSTNHSFNVIFSITTYFLIFFNQLASKCLPSLSFVFPLLSITFAALQKPRQGNFEKFQRSGESRFDGSENDRSFLKITKWQQKLVRTYKRGKLVSFFPNNAAKTCLFGPKILETLEIGPVFQSRAFFHFSSNLYRSCLSTFENMEYLIF